MIKKIFGYGILVLVAIVFLSGCMTTDEEKKPQQTIEKLSISGSTTVLPIAQKAAEAFMDANQNADIQIMGGGSSVGIKSVGEGTAKIGMASRDIKDSEKKQYPYLIEHVIAKDGIAIIVHTSNTINSLSLEQVMGVYDGTYRNWNQLGGPNQEIVVIGRDSASGTREFFWEFVMKKGNFIPGMLEMNSNGAVKQQVSQTPGAIGYVGLGYVDSFVKAVKIDIGDEVIDPTVKNVLEGKYPISRSMNMYTHGKPTGLAKEYLEFILSVKGQEIVKEEGFVPLEQAGNNGKVL